MTLEEAKKALSGRLDFGSPDQIRASNFIKNSERIAEMIEAEKFKPSKCWLCDGTGEHECECGDEHECSWCLGVGVKGTMSFQLRKELKLHPDAFMAALEMIEDNK